MKRILALALISSILTVGGIVQAQTVTDESSEFTQLETTQNAANSKAGPRSLPARMIPVPDTVSPQLQSVIAGPYRLPVWNANPKSAAEWKELVARLAAAGAAAQPAIREKLGVKMESDTMGGAHVYILTPKQIPRANKNRLLIHVHGGGYVFNPGEAGTWEAIMMAAYGGFEVISVDYRIPPDYPYPAAMDDAMAVWKAALKMQKARNMAIFGTSTGGGMTLALRRQPRDCIRKTRGRGATQRLFIVWHYYTCKRPSC
jgi:acetyl esterase/lipase